MQHAECIERCRCCSFKSQDRSAKSKLTEHHRTIHVLNSSVRAKEKNFAQLFAQGPTLVSCGPTYLIYLQPKALTRDSLCITSKPHEKCTNSGKLKFATQAVLFVPSPGRLCTFSNFQLLSPVISKPVPSAAA